MLSDRVHAAELATGLGVDPRLVLEAGSLAFVGVLPAPAGAKGKAPTWPRRDVERLLADRELRARVVVNLRAVMQDRGVYLAGGPVAIKGPAGA